MDTNGDGVIDDPLATKKKPGRKSLGLNAEEMKAHREVLRKRRLDARRQAEKKELLETLVWDIANTYDMNKQEAFSKFKDADDAEDELTRLMNNYIDSLTKDRTLIIKQNQKGIAGYNGERLQRKRK